MMSDRCECGCDCGREFDRIRAERDRYRALLEVVAAQAEAEERVGGALYTMTAAEIRAALGAALGAEPGEGAED
jgi:hypothetical protein